MARFIPRRMPHLPFRIPFFRIFYSTTYTILYIIVLVMLCINPAAMIYTAFDQNAYQYIFEIGGVYILTAVLALFIYFSRLYTNRTVLAAVGKSYIPVEEGEVVRNVRKMIARALERSATIALESRPRDLSDNIKTVISNDTAMTNEKLHSHPSVGRVLKLDPQNPPWGRIQHSGWSTPSQGDTNLPSHVQFRTVIHELPNLIEAKAVSCAPPDPFTSPMAVQPGDAVPADPLIVDLLRRSPTADLRTYLAHLSQLGLVDPSEAADDFLYRYDRARFSCVPLSEADFEALMGSFAFLLTNMQELSPAIIGEVRANYLADDSTDTSSIAGTSMSSSSRSASIAGSVRKSRAPVRIDRMPSRYTSMTGASYDTAPSPSTQFRSPMVFQSPGGMSEATPRPQTANTHFSNSVSTMRRAASRETLGSVGSVLRTVPGSLDNASISSGSSGSSLRSRSLRSYAGSVIRHSPATKSRRDLPTHGWVPPG